MFAAVRRFSAAEAVTRSASVVRDALMLLVIVFCIPFVILGIGLPIALFVQFLLWIGAALFTA